MKHNVNTTKVVVPVLGTENLSCASHRNLREGVNSPSFFISPPQQLAFDCVRDNTTRELHLFCTLKSIANRQGYVPIKGLIAALQAITGDKQARTVTARLNRLKAWGWISYGKHSLFIQGWDNIKNLTGIRSRNRTRLNIMRDFITQIFTQAISPMYRYQNYLFTPEKRGASERKKRRKVTPKEKHRGGLALVLISEFFAKSKAWAFNLKKKCKALRLLTVEARFIKRKDLTPFDVKHGNLHPSICVRGCKVYERISDVVLVNHN